MKVIAINACTYGSTGNIMFEISNNLRNMGATVYTVSPKGRAQKKLSSDKHIYIGTIFSRNIHIFLAKITGLHESFSIISTIRFLNKIKKINPDIIHLHNLHGDYINIFLLFKYIKKNNIKVIWTLHDCWSFTGHCPHYERVKCNKWETGCFKCPIFKSYPSSYIDTSKLMWRLKRKTFLGIENMTIVTPSFWLYEQVKKSFLKEYNVIVINNGIDLSIFKPTNSDKKKELNIRNNAFIILGVAFGWNEKKGLDIFVKLYKKLDNKYKILLVGTDESVDRVLPQGIISIHRISDTKELAKIYSIADIFLNPTREEVLGMVNIEALACGTPVLTFNTGGSPECINEKCGQVITDRNVENIANIIKNIRKNRIFKSEDCIKQALKYSKANKYNEYINLYINKMEEK